MLRIVTFFVWMFSALVAHAETHVALVIGNADYSALTKLSGPAHDAADVEIALRELGYTILPPPTGKSQNVNLTRREMWAQLDALAKAAREAKLVLLYYAGHGFEVEGVNYLLPTDLLGSSSASIKSDGLNLDMVLTTVQNALPAGSSAVVVLDACRNDGTSRGGRGMVSIEERGSFLVAFATSKEKIAEDLGPNRRNSPYTQAFLEQLKQNPKVPLSNFFIEVKKRVQQISSQSPNNLVGLTDSMVGLVPGAVLPDVAQLIVPAQSTATTQPATMAPAGATLVALRTSQGLITLELDSANAPKSVENFLTYVRSGFYNGTVFHRVIDGFMIQGGGYDADLQAKPSREAILNEATNGLKNSRGTVAMARTSDPNSATAQFFINLVNNRFLDHHPGNPRTFGYAVFGRVVGGMDVVDKIAKLPTATRSAEFANAPTELVVIEEATLMRR